MKDLNEYISIFKKGLMSKSLMKFNKNESLIKNLFEGILHSKIKTNDNAFSLLDIKDRNYRSLWNAKRDLKFKVLNAFFNSGFHYKTNTKAKKKLVKAIQYFAIARIMGLQGFRKIEERLLNDVVKISIKYEFLEIAILSLRRLQIHYAVRDVNKKIYLKTVKKLDELQELNVIENDIQKKYYELAIEFYDGKHKNGQLHQLLIKYVDELNVIPNEKLSFSAKRYVFSILSTKLLFEGNYKEAIKNARSAINNLSKYELFDNRIKFSYSVDIILANILLGNYLKADNNCQFALDYVQKNTYHYYVIMSYKFFNFSLSRKYNKMYYLVKLVKSTSNIKTLEFHYQKWKIREAYVRFLLESGKISLPEEETPKRFRLARFLNDVPIYTKDKRGFNISILVIQMLFYIVRRNYGNVIDRIDALKQYSFKYLRDDDTFRSNCFIKMLIKIPGANFHPVRTRLHTKDLEARLRAREMTVEELLGEVEVIPFHDLWDIIIEVLEVNWKIKTGKA